MENKSIFRIESKSQLKHLIVWLGNEGKKFLPGT